MKYNIEQTVKAANALETYIEQLRHGFGEDDVGGSYDRLYRDLIRIFPELQQSLRNAELVLWELDVPDVKEMCYKANDLIRKAQSFDA